MPRVNRELKETILAHLRQYHPSMCRHWFDDIEPVEVKGGVMKMLVREPVQLRYLQQRCTEPFSEAASSVTGHLCAVRFVGEDDSVGATRRLDEPGSGFKTFDGSDDMLLSPDYSFENFVVGPGNQLAHAAAKAVAKKPGRAYNPFFIHGGVGLGKTHLLQAICQLAMRNNPSMSVHYTSCNGFMTHFVDALQQGHMSEFRHRFRNIDLLVIDDIHDLSKRDQTQEEFFHTFNALYQAGKQIVLSSDAAPQEIPDLEERLTSRFNCGLVTRIEKPCFETRISILKKKAEIRNMELPDDVASYIASRIDTNIRELEGAVTKIQGIARLMHTEVSLELAKQAIGEAISVNGHQPTIQNIIDVISGYYDVKLADLLSKRRHKSIAMPRQVGMWLARKYTRYSLEEIGGYFGGRDHTTVMHAIKTIGMKQEKDPTLKEDVTRLEQRISTAD